MLSDSEWQKLQELERQFAGRSSRQARRLSRRLTSTSRHAHHRSARRMAMLGVAFVAAGSVDALGILMVPGVLLLFGSLVRWHWTEVRQEWRRPHPETGP